MIWNRVWLRRTELVLLQLAFTALLIFLWQYSADHHIVNAAFFSKPSAVWAYLKNWSSGKQGNVLTGGTTLWQDLEATAIIFGYGYLVAVALGIILGLLVGTVRIAREILEPFIAFMNAIPKLALLPLLVVIFGFGYLAQVLLVVVICVFFISVNVATAVQDTSREFLNNARVLGASRLAIVRAVYLPSVTIWLLSTARVTIGYAMQAAIASEFIGAARGIGFRFVLAQATFNADEMFAAFTVVLLLALLVDTAMAQVQKRFTSWMPAGGKQHVP